LGKHLNAIFTENQNCKSGIEDSLLTSSECLNAEIIESSELKLNFPNCTEFDEDLASIDSQFGTCELAIPTNNMQLLNKFELEVLKKIININMVV